MKNLFYTLLILTLGTQGTAVQAQCFTAINFYTTFDDSLDGAPQPGSGTLEHQIEWGVWRGDAYTFDNVVEGETYTFHACEGPQALAWDLDFTVGYYVPDSMLIYVHGFGTDSTGDYAGCGVTFTAEYSGLFLALVNEVDSCGLPVNEIDGGFPTLVLHEVSASKDIAIENFEFNYSAETEQLSLKADQPLMRIEVFNVIGQSVLTRDLVSNQEIVSMAGIQDGLYIAHIVDENGHQESVKVVK